MQPKLTVIIPVYKVEKYLKKCLDSVVNQTFRDIEIIIIDDGSPDNCGKICDQYAKGDSRIDVVHKNNGGLCAARNDGIERATGEWITFVDSDDWLDLNYYEDMFNNIKGKQADVYVAGGHIVEYDNRHIIRYNCHEDVEITTKTETDMLMAKILAPLCGEKAEGKQAASMGSPWDKLYNADFLKKNSLLFDEDSKAWEDLLFNFYVFGKAQKVIMGTNIGYHYRMIGTSITKKFNPEREIINYYFIDKLVNYMKGRERSEIIDKAIKVRSINMISNMMKSYYFHPDNKESYYLIAKKIKLIKKEPYYADAILCKYNDLLSHRQKILVNLLKLPVIFPLKIASFM